jgi:prophage antirepressor-like protein
MSALEVFRFDTVEVRTLVLDGEPWFVLADVCAALDLSNPTVTAARVDQDALSEAEVIDSMGRRQTARIVNESGLYEVAIRSNKPEALAFRRWITREVLPSIRRTGSYTSAPALPQSYSAALRELAATVEHRDALVAEVAVLEPRAEAWDELASAEGDYSVADAAAMLNRAGIQTGRDRLFAKLADLRWIYRGEKGRWRPYASALDAGYMTERAQPPHRDADGELVPSPPQVRVTIRGVERLRVRLGSLTGDA